MTSPVGYKEWAALFALGRDVHDVHSLRFTSRVTHVSADVGSQILIRRPPAQQSNALTTWPPIYNVTVDEERNFSSGILHAKSSS